MLKDKFGRKHDYLRISLTDKCNLRCFYCMPEHPDFMPNNQLMTTEEILGIANIFISELGVNKIRLTGGEPLARKEAPEILRALHKTGVEIALTTNGVLLDKFFPVFDEIGLRSINISLDSITREGFAKITKRDYYDQVMANIDQALGRGMSVKLNMVVMRGHNEHEIPDFIEFTRNKPVHVRFIEFMPFDSNNWKWDKVLSYREMLEMAMARFPVQKLIDAPHSTAKSFHVRGFEGTFAVISSITAPFCADCNRIRLTADGKLRNCLFSTREWDLLTPYRAGKPLAPVIETAILAKAAQRGGLPAFKDQDALLERLDGRSMVKIGG